MKTSAVFTLCGAAVLAAGAAAQTTPPPPQGPTIRTSMSEVSLDLVVRDKHGKPVKNLKASDVEVLEDGAPQEVTSFRFANTKDALPDKKASPAAPGPKLQPVAPPRELKAVNVLCVVFHNIDPVSRQRAMEILHEFMKTHLEPDTFVGLFSLDDSGLTALHPFTNDRAELERIERNLFSLIPVDLATAAEPVITANPLEVIVDVAISGQGAGTAVDATMRVSGGEVSKRVITGADVGNSAGANIMRGVQVTNNRDNSHVSGMREYDKINGMIKALATLPGRKSVLLLSTGFTTTGDPDLIEPMYARANQAGITVYSVDVAGLSEVDRNQAADLSVDRVAGVSRTQTTINSSLSEMKEKSRQGDTMNQAVRASDSQASLRALAESTGGFLVANTNEFRKPFQRIADDLEGHYEITYRPPSGKLDGRYHKIAVKLSRPDLLVESRTGYFAMPELNGSTDTQPFETIGLAVLNLKQLPHAFDLRSAFYRFRNVGGTTQGELVFEVPGSALSATGKPEHGSHVLHASLLALVKDESGQVVDKYSVDRPYEIPDANLELLRKTPLMYTHPISLAAGKYTVEAALVDREGRRSSAGQLAFEIPAAANGLSMSSPILLRGTEPAGSAPDPADPMVLRGQRLDPYLDMTLPSNAEPKLYFVVYPDKSKTDKPKLQVEFRVDGQVLANQTSNLPAPDASGAIPLIIKAATHPGKCELKITALQGGDAATGSISYSITSPR